MDFESVVYFIVFVVWAVGKVAGLVKRVTNRPQPAGPDDYLANAKRDLEAIAEQATALLPRMDSEVRARIAPILDRVVMTENRRLRGELAAADPGDPNYQLQVLKLLGETRDHLFTGQQNLLAARTVVDRRANPAVTRAHQVADRLLAGCYAPILQLARDRGMKLALPDPVAVILDRRENDPLDGTAVGAVVVRVPSAVVAHPWRWYAIGEELGEQIPLAIPGLQQEIWDLLALSPSSEASAGSDQMAPVLLSSWLQRLLGDVIGSLLFGPDYLRAVVAATASPRAAARVTAVPVGQGGVVHLEPPAHIRVHVCAHWLALMGFERDGGEQTANWDLLHRAPESLQLTGGFVGGSIPIEPLLGAARAMLKRLFNANLRSLGGRNLSSLPGLDGWSRLEATASTATAAIQRGSLGPPEARPLIAAAIRASLVNQAIASDIEEGLLRSVVGSGAAALAAPAPTARKAAGPPPTAAKVPKVARVAREAKTAKSAVDDELLAVAGLVEAAAGQRRPAKPAPRRPPPAKQARTVRARTSVGRRRVTGQEVAEAIVIGEILLAPRGRRS